RDRRLLEIPPLEQEIEIVFSELVIGFDAGGGAEALAIGDRLRRSKIVATREMPPAAAQDDNAHRLVRQRQIERPIDLVEHTIALRVLILRQVQRDDAERSVGGVED